MSEQGYQGTATPQDSQGDYNATSFLVRMLMGHMATSTLGRVVAVTNSGGVAPVGFVDVQPLVHQVDGQGQPVPHAVIYSVPYFRLQGGTSAVILDPAVGDIGFVLFADHDLSKVIATKAAALPGSDRRFDMADALFIGGGLNGAPQQIVRFHAGGIELMTPGAVKIQAGTRIDLTAPLIGLNGPVTQTAGSGGGTGVQLVGPVAVTGDVSAGGVSLINHAHSGVQPGGGTSGKPV